jgi:hypothetical protein
MDLRKRRNPSMQKEHPEQGAGHEVPVAQFGI